MEQDGEYHKTKVNYEFTHNNIAYVRQSMTTLKSIARELRLRYAFITRDKGYFDVGKRARQVLVQHYNYQPRY